MPRWQRVWVTACAGCIAFALGYVGVDYGKLPRLVYFQLSRRFALAGPLAGLPSNYVGIWLWALVAGLLVAAVTWLVAGRRRTRLGERALGLAAAWAGTAWLIAVGYFVWNNWP